MKKFYLDELPQFYFFLRGGLLGLGHINKGTPEMGHKRSSFGLLMLDLWVVWRGVLVIVKGGGY